MKTYYIKYPRNFGNEYDLCYCETSEERSNAEENGWERISRKDAIGKCRTEKRRRWENPSFAFFAPTQIVPFSLVGKEYLPEDVGYRLSDDGYIWEKR